MGEKVKGIGHRISRFSTGRLDIYCPGFFTLHWARGCPFSCSYCYLRRTFRRLPDGKAPKVYDHAEVLRHLDKFLRADELPGEELGIRPAVLNAGELTDSLSQRQTGQQLMNEVVGRFTDPDQNPKGRVLLLLTKNASVRRFRDLDAHVYEDGLRNVIFSMTLNSPQFVADFERGTPSIEARLRVLAEAKKERWRVRVRLDPVWRYDYDWVCRRLLDIGPELVTLGSFRFYPQDRSWFVEDGPQATKELRMDVWSSLTDEGPDGRLRAPGRLQWFEDIADLLPGIRVGLCKEPMDVFSKFSDFCRRDSFLSCNCLP